MRKLSLILASMASIFAIVTWLASSTEEDVGMVQQQENPLWCVGSSNVSLNQQGFAVILPQTLLVESFPDYSIFEVDILDPNIHDDTVRCEHLGQNLQVSVTNTVTNNVCWTYVLVEDKLAPIIECRNDTLPCTVDINNLPDSLRPTATDNCTDIMPSHFSLMNITENPFPCNGTSNTNYVTEIIREWRVTDDYGMTDTCSQRILIERLSVHDVQFPPRDTVYCPNGDTSLAGTGQPMIEGMPLSNSGLCMLVFNREDDIFDKCDGSYGIRRTFNVVDWCSGDDTTYTQIIDVLDTVPPVVDCPLPRTLMASSNCQATFHIQEPPATDACSDIIEYSYFLVGVSSIQSITQTITLDTGTHIIRIEIRDACGNTATCDQEVTVVDNTAPNCAGCSPLSVHIDSNGMASITVDSLFGCTFMDECGFIVDTAIRRMTDACGMPSNLVYGDEVTFCCEDIGNEVMVLIQLIDNNGNVGGCMIPVTVTGDGLVLECPADMTVNCTGFDPNANFGSAIFSTNCGHTLDSTSTFTGLNACGEGTLTKRWTATSLTGMQTMCEQVITIENQNAFGLPNINFPPDVTIDCNASTATSNTGQATFMLTPPDDCRTVNVTFSDSIPTGQQGQVCFTLFRTWVVTDACNPNNPFVDVQRIVIDDNEAPVITCPADVTVTCGGDTSVSNTGLPTATDNCVGVITNFTRTQTVTPGTGNILETITRVWTATDACGNSASCTQVIVVEDDGAPTITCPQNITVNADNNACQADITIPMPVVNDCSGVATVTNDYNGTNDASDTYPVGTTTVTFTAVDGAGMMVQCSFTVTVIDNQAPTITCPMDLTVECDEALFPLSQFGMPTFNDNCPNPTLTMDSTVNTPGCQDGLFTRTFTVTDGAGLTATCTQRIVVSGTDVLDSLDFIWPAPVVQVFDCIEIDDVPITGPTLMPGVGVCNTVTFDTMITMVNATIGCMDFNIAHIVTDSCNFDPITGAGQWVYNQTVAFFDTVAPVINAIADPDPVFADTNSCDAFVSIPPLTATDCNTFTITNDSDFALDTFADASGTYPEGTTEVNYTVTDKCGNTSNFSIEVVVIDTVPPTLTCLKSEYQLPDTNGLFLTARDISMGWRDNCTDSLDIIVIFSLNDPTDTLRVFDCDNIGEVFDFPVYAIDASGNVDSCVDRIGVDDPMNVCPDSTMTLTAVEGQVITALNVPIQDVSMLMTMDGGFYETSSSQDGSYTFSQIEGPTPLRIDAEKVDHVLNGVTVNDLSLIQQHIIGLQPLDNGYLEMAADANGDGSVDLRDVAELRRLLLGLVDELPVATWRFYDAQYDMGVIDPLDQDIPDYLMIYDDGISFDADMIGIKVGDVDLSAELGFTQSASDRYRSDVAIQLTPMSVSEEDMVTVALSIEDAEHIAGGQFHIELPNNAQIQDIRMNEALGLDATHMNKDSWRSTELRVVWTSTSTTVSSGDVLCWMSVPRSAMEDTWRVAGSFLSEMIDADGNTYGVSLRQSSEMPSAEANTPSASTNSFELFQNVPNPFTNETIIRYELPEDAVVTMTLFDARGALIHERTHSGVEGINEIILEGGVFANQSGVIYYQLRTDEFSAVRRMTRLAR